MGASGLGQTGFSASFPSSNTASWSSQGRLGSLGSDLAAAALAAHQGAGGVHPHLGPSDRFGPGGSSNNMGNRLPIPRNPSVSLDLTLNNSAGVGPHGAAAGGGVGPPAGSVGNGAVAARDDDGSTHGSRRLGAPGPRAQEAGAAAVGGASGAPRDLTEGADAGSSHGGTTFMGLSSLLGSLGGSHHGGSAHGGSVHSALQMRGAAALALLESSAGGGNAGTAAATASALGLLGDHWHAGGGLADPAAAALGGPTGAQALGDMGGAGALRQGGLGLPGVSSAADVSQLEALLGGAGGGPSAGAGGSVPQVGPGGAALTSGETRVHGGRSAFVALRGFQPIGGGQESGAPGSGADLVHSQSVPALASQLEGSQHPLTMGRQGSAQQQGLWMGLQALSQGQASGAGSLNAFGAPQAGAGHHLGALFGSPPMGTSPHNLGTLQGFAIGVPGGGGSSGVSPSGQPSFLADGGEAPPSLRGATAGGGTVTVKATFGSDTVRFRVPLDGVAFRSVEEGVASRVKLRPGEFSLKYLDEDGEWVVLASEQDMVECLDIAKAQGSSVIKLVVKDEVQR